MLEMNEKRSGKVASKRKGIQQNQINVFLEKLEYNTGNETKGSHFLLCVDLARKKPRSLRPCSRVI